MTLFYIFNNIGISGKTFCYWFLFRVNHNWKKVVLIKQPP